jgi:hypothetical protein
MTRNGRGRPNWLTNSAWAVPAKPSMRSVAMARTRRSNSARGRRWNALFTTRRTTVCVGGSLFVNELCDSQLSLIARSVSAVRSCGASTESVEENRAGSRMTVTMSSYRVTYHICSTWLKKTGSSRRARS